MAVALPRFGGMPGLGLAERLAVKDVVQLTGLDHATIRRLRQLDTDDGEGGGDAGDDGEAVSRGTAADPSPCARGCLIALTDWLTAS